MEKKGNIPPPLQKRGKKSDYKAAGNLHPFRTYQHWFDQNDLGASLWLVVPRAATFKGNIDKIELTNSTSPEHKTSVMPHSLLQGDTHYVTSVRKNRKKKKNQKSQFQHKATNYKNS